MCIMMPVSPIGVDGTSARDKTSNPHEMQAAQLPGIHIEPFTMPHGAGKQRDTGAFKERILYDACQ